MAMIQSFPTGSGNGTSKISQKLGNAATNITGSTNSSEDGLYVEDVSPFLNSINIEQKVTNKPAITELLSSTVSMTLNSATTLGKAVSTVLNIDIPLKDDITNYEKIGIWLCPKTSTRSRVPQLTDIRVKDIVYNTSSTTALEDGGSNITCMYNVDNADYQTAGAVHFTVKGWFKDATTLHINICTNA